MDAMEIINYFIENIEKNTKELNSYKLKILKKYQKFAEGDKHKHLLVFLEFINEQEKQINTYFERYENSDIFLDCAEVCACIERYFEDGTLLYEYDDLIYCDETSVCSSYVEGVFKDELRSEVYRKLSNQNLSNYFDYEGYLDDFCDIFEILGELDVYYVTKYPEELNGEAIYIIGDRSYALR